MTRTLGSTLRRIDANELHRRGALAEGSRCRWSWQIKDQPAAQVVSTCDGSSLRLQYRYTKDGTWTEIRLDIRIAWKKCPFGGRRAFFACPVEGCSRFGYIFYGDKGFVCRTCRRVAYALQRLTPTSRALARAQQLRLALGGTVDLNMPLPPRPKGMQEWTYTRRAIQILAAESKANQAVLTLFGNGTKVREEPPTLFDLGKDWVDYSHV